MNKYHTIKNIISSPTDGHVGCFLRTAILSNTAVNILGYVSLHTYERAFLWCGRRSRIDGLWWMHICLSYVLLNCSTKCLQNLHWYVRIPTILSKSVHFSDIFKTDCYENYFKYINMETMLKWTPISLLSSFNNNQYICESYFI